MVLSGSRGGLWRSAQQYPARIPLRIKLISSLLALVIVALLLISFAGLSFLSRFLLGQADTSLTTFAGFPLHETVQQYLQNPQPNYRQGVAVMWKPDGGSPQQILIPTSGTGISSQQVIPGPRLPANPSSLPGDPRHAVTLAATSGDGRWRVVGLRATLVGQGSTAARGTVVVGLDVTSVYSTLGELRNIDAIVSLAIIVGLAIVSIVVVRTSLRPLTEIERTAEGIAAGDLSRRVPDRDPRTEVGRLGRSLNAMLAQIETAFRARAGSEAAARRSEEKMRQFVADASHELRTPLTAIRGFAEYYRQRGGVEGSLAAADLNRIMRRVEQESKRMGVLVEDMLMLARLDQQRPLERRPVDLLTLAADAVHDARVVAPGRRIELTVGSGAALLVLGDEIRLRQVIGNLMSNALAHTPEGTPVEVRIRSGSLEESGGPGDRGAPDPAAGPAGRSAAILEVADQGPGLTPDQAERAFERFYRGDKARTSGGTGLGLAIVAALVTAHGGRVWVESQPAGGAVFRIALPLAPEALTPDPLDNGPVTEADPDREPDVIDSGGPAGRRSAS